MARKKRLLRRLARSIVFLSCGYAAACGGADPVNTDTTPDPPQISSVSPDPMVEGQPAILTGSNFSANTASNTVKIDNVTLLVTAASTTSLTVTIPEGCGPLRIANLQVTVGGITSSAFSATVAPDPDGDAVQNVEIAVGDQVVYRQPRHCFGLPTNGGAAQYLLGVQSTGGNGSVTRQVTVKGSIFGAALAVSATPVAAAAAAPDGPPRYSPQRENLGASPAYGLIQRHREAHHALLADLIRPVRDPAVRFGALSAHRAPARVIVDGTENVGDQVDLRIRGLAEGDGCSAASTVTVTAELRVKTTRSMWWVDVANPPEGFLDSELQELGTFFDDVIWAAEVAEFGDVGDLDGNGRVAILITKEINADTTSGGQLLGFVNPCDFFLRDATGLFASNEGEFFYALAPDPAGVVGDALSSEALLEVLPVIVAHEFAHIIQGSRRAASATALDFMAPFVVEGQATLAEEIVGHVVLGNATGQNINGAVAFDANDDQVYPWYIAPFLDLVFYFGFPGSSTDPRVQGAPQECSWIDDVEHPCGGRPLWYGVTWSFLRWASDLYGAALGGEPAFQTALIDGDLSGFANLEQALASQGTLEDHLARWAATLYMDDRPGASLENSMSSWDLFSFTGGLLETAWLYPVEYGFTDFTETVTIRDPSTAYFLIGGFGASSHTLRVTGPSGGDLASDVQVWLVRTQ